MHPNDQRYVNRLHVNLKRSNKLTVYHAEYDEDCYCFIIYNSKGKKVADQTYDLQCLEDVFRWMAQEQIPATHLKLTDKHNPNSVTWPI